MKFRLVFLLLLLAFAASFFSCKPKPGTVLNTSATPDQNFDKYKALWVQKLWRIYPDWASSAGYHRHDSVLALPTEDRRKRIAYTFRTRLAEMDSMDLQALSPNNQTDFRMMQNFMQNALWQDSVLRTHEWDPSIYNIGNSVAEILNGRYDSLNIRLRAISHKLLKVPLYYETAIANLQKPTVEHTELAILQNKGTAKLFGKAMLDSVEASTLKPVEKEQLKQRIETAQMAVSGYARHLENSLLPKLKKNKNARSFRIGKEMFARKFEVEIQAGNTSEEIYQKALTRKAHLHKEMVRLSRQLWPKYFTESAPQDSLEMVGKMIEKLSENHVSRQDFVSAIRK